MESFDNFGPDVTPHTAFTVLQFREVKKCHVSDRTGSVETCAKNELALVERLSTTHFWISAVVELRNTDHQVRQVVAVEVADPDRRAEGIAGAWCADAEPRACSPSFAACQIERARQY